MKLGTVSIKANNAARRFDASFHLSDGKNALRAIKHSPYTLINIGDAAQRIWHAGRWRRVYVNDPTHGITLVGSSAMLKADLSDEKLVSRLYTEDIEDKILKKGWTLISCSGTIGNCAFTNAQHPEKLASQDVLRAGVIYAYLSTSYGYNMLTQGTFGAVIQHIEPQHVQSIPIPSFPESFQQQVDDLIQESARLREEATEILNATTELLQKELSLLATNKYKKSGMSSIRNIFKSQYKRFDAPVFLNEQDIEERSDTVKLGELDVDIWYPGIFKRTYVQDGFPYIKGSALLNVNPFVRCEKLSRTKTPMLDQLWLREGQILITCAGACGDIKLITKEYDNKQAIGSPDIIRVKSNDGQYTLEYLFAYLRLPAIYQYLQSIKYGSVIERFDAQLVRNIPIVKASPELCAKVTELIKRYKDCTYQAFCAEEQAIRMVESEIESWSK